MVIPSTCHSYLARERKNFEDQGVSDLLNERFISIKVDCEERLDIDAVHNGLFVR
ncbi:DUF255 domain-containing protein [Peribacillus loiseleuriae]|uniref:DUF255 domain-containing protein n=1 Tax=Peribacillus loiseleuriae TaxID=1679170 RepID=UPI0009E1C254